MSKSRSSRRLIVELIIGVILVLSLIATILVAEFVEGITQQFVTIAFITLGILVLSFISYGIFYRLYKARPELFTSSSQSGFRKPIDSVHSDTTRFEPIIKEAKPELFYEGPNGKRIRVYHDSIESDKKRSSSPYDSVKSDSYQYKPNRGSGKKPFTDFCLEETTICFICKLKLDKNEKIYRCPECRSPFHIKHLAEWLNENSDCPVCNVELSL